MQYLGSIGPQKFRGRLMEPAREPVRRTYVCSLCLQFRAPLFALPDQGHLVEACHSCWLTRELQQLAARLEANDPALEAANGIYRSLYTLLRGRVEERIQAQEIPAFPPAALPFGER